MNIKKNNKGIIPILILVVVVIVVGAYLLYRSMQSTNMQTSYNTMPVPTQYSQDYQTASSSVPTVNDTSDLDKASTELDSTGSTELDTELNSLNTQANF